MFQQLRIGLTTQFVLLSILIYLVLAAMVSVAFYVDLTGELDLQLRELASTADDVVNISGDTFQFERDPHLCQDKTFHVKPAIQFWSADKKLIRSFGSPGVETYFDKPSEVKLKGNSLRCLSNPIEKDDKLLGFVQVQMSTSDRDKTVARFLYVCLYVTPILFFGLSFCGYLFSARAIKPVEESYVLQKRFLSDAGHELKTPISVIKAGLENLSQTVKDKESIDRVGRITRAAERIEKLVTDLLLLTKTEQFTESLDLSRVELDMLLRETLGEFADLFDDKEVQLVGDKIEKVTIEGNKDGLHTVFSNLIKNALLYTPSGGTVTVSVVQSGNHSVVSVADTGIGIAPENQKKLFDRFYRVDESRSRAEGGTGLGLSIVQAMVARHNGEITVESELGKGTTFIVTLPLS
ncbi:MAG: HAMP domain-containing histidine kinase [Cyanobacteria bacterium]|nr:HAMP domain-containing histidine kinase [Cyanobacteriota bacterium]